MDQWFEAKTKGLTDPGRAQLKQRWGTMQKVLSSQPRLGKIAADILMDMETRDRLESGRGNALDEDIGDLKAMSVLDFCIREICPSIYNQAIADAEAYFQEKTSDLGGERYEPELYFWKKRGDNGRSERGLALP